ncbi:methyltransferase family protein [Psychrobacter jeotgali]|uniref:methyltransferase family protein n=1 Tax=Psychrobacter jeotgali TaxID=179010 RepID=UPI00191B85F2|nr:isoprenylcysteine carboxylmethyltransferase family protein [Psychrobacter jeotgali]
MLKSLELKIPPVVHFAVVGGTMYLVSKQVPKFDYSLTGSKVLASVVAISGVTLGIKGVIEFKKEQTTPNPHTPDKATALVTQGVYQYSRNPMYFGLLTVLIAWGLYLSNLLAFLLLPLFIIIMNRLQIKPEERVLAEKFGKTYQAYKAKVRRWI